ncbi:PREDICTED: pentatricopeptide repeat-containing protein At3g22150, chloroplastic-like isoform X2 [Camelina sativa]|uniref:Pentatricopeptide repeat-containing protein At3g22150, chloroplastic-like isoform X1 n=1 Tax=Camelina sativa TaxID=90675 RepID=A0ABM1Q8A5_CAMSA|nr:PREDICTED: pentatricopeptide repeat-containing protein At3g22150, chloroplastic-like isoform X1 [Camelina sativa]XP_019082993.1 PREDICTED: pentatricopeptide repeat-containing protein At3g22150, chloroplastic-like isoform X2 [Camelina sativa]
MAGSALPLPPPPPLSLQSPSQNQTRPSSTFSPPTLTPQTPSIRSRLSKICQDGNPQLARQLFDAIPKPTTVLWNTIIIGFICNNLPHEALLFYSRMKKTAPFTKCDPYTYSSTLKACAETKNLKAGKAVHCHLIRCLQNSSRVVHNSLMNMYVSCLNGPGSELDSYEYDVVRKVFDHMRRKNVVAWNTLISWYVRTGRNAEACRQFSIMMRMEIKPSPVSFVNVFPAVSTSKSIKKANVFYGLMLKLGDEYVKDLFVVSSAISMYAELGDFVSSRRVFDSCVERNIEVWNTMIGVYVQNEFLVESIELFLEAVGSKEIVSDEVTFLLAASAVSALQQVELGRQFHGFVSKKFRELPVVIFNSLMVMYSRCGSVHESFGVFHSMQERDVVSWNSMISAFVQNGLDDEGLMLVYEMQKQGFKVDYITVTCLLSAASNLRNKEIGKQTHGFLIRHGIQFEGMNSYLIDMYAKAGLIRISQKLFERSGYAERDQATWNSMISGFTQNGLTEETFVVFRRMLEQSIQPNAVTVASILPACSHIGSVDLGKQLHGFSIRQYLDDNVFFASALVDMYSKSGAIKYAENMFSQTKERNSVTYTTMILGYGQHGMGERAISLFRSMQDSGIKPDAITFVAVLSACSYSGLVDEGLKIFEEMRELYNIQPSSEHYCCITDMLGRVGRVNEAYEFVKELGEDGNIAELWGSLLGACRLHGELELAETVSERLAELDKGKNFSGYQVLLSNMYAEEQNWKSVDRVRRGMREKGLRKEVGRSDIEVAGYVNCFVSRDQEHPQSGEIYDVIDGLAKDMRGDSFLTTLPNVTPSLELDE